MPKATTLNVLADRYATPRLVKIWSTENKIQLERRLWIEILRAQKLLGLDTPDGAIEAYEAAVNIIDLGSINARERVTRHDVKARIEEFDALAGYELIHRGMTSRDLTDNVEQVQIRQSLEYVHEHLISILAHLGRRAVEFSGLAITGRSHNVPAQITTLGKRFANAAQEVLLAYWHIEDLLQRYPLRGIKGAMGTGQDMLDLLGGNTKALEHLEHHVASVSNFSYILTSVGQIYPRSLDFEVISALVQAAAGPSSFATTIRLMAGQDIASEGFLPGQVGSSAMPHKQNARTSERVCGLAVVLDGYLTMARGLSGNQWNEGDVSCSVVRRVCLPDAFYAIDGLMEGFLTVLNGFGAYPAMISRELERNLPFLATTKLLMAAVKAGADREVTHAVIGRHAKAVARQMKLTGQDANDLYEQLGADPDYPLSYEQILAVITDPLVFTGAAQDQVAQIVGQIELITRHRPEAAAYEPGDIL